MRRRPVLITTPPVTPEEAARIYGVSKSRLKWIMGLVDARHPRKASSMDVTANSPKSKIKADSGKRRAAKKYRASTKRRRSAKAAA